MVRSERIGAAALVTIDRPERRNAVDGATAAALREAFEAFAADGGARVLVLTGAGEAAFCAGADLKALDTLDVDAPGGPLGFTRLASPKPAIAAVAGGTWPAGWSWRCGATCGSPPRARASAAWSGAGACR
jgi:enoyl-CoA hydratase